MNNKNFQTFFDCSFSKIKAGTINKNKPNKEGLKWIKSGLEFFIYLLNFKKSNHGNGERK